MAGVKGMFRSQRTAELPPRRRYRLWVAGWLMLACIAVPASADPLWLDPLGRPAASARDALRLLADAGSDGLAPQDYRVDELSARAVALDAAPGTADASQFERDLGEAMRRFVHDLHVGRVDPRSVGFQVARPRDAEPLGSLLDKAVSSGRLPELIGELRPRFEQYAQLRSALARYRALAAEAAWTPLRINTPLKPGERSDSAVDVRRRLVALGDVPADSNLEGTQYDAALAQAVGRFQSRHGLPVDGVIGRATLASLNVPLPTRVHQIELAMERLRWLPAPGSQPLVGINIPMFRLWAYDPARSAERPLGMGVVVGRALNTRTPVLSAEIRHLIFRPYWNVPRSIVRNELLPALARDPGYLARHDMEIVRGPGDDAEIVPQSSESLSELRLGALRVRQRPGPKNSLGLVKFIFPNAADVYLHATPATELFGRARRDFSHGCVRVEDPIALAQWLLQDQAQWSRERITQAMAGTAPLRVELARPVPVVLFYMTAMSMPEDHALHFADDLYGHDARLTRALAMRRMH